MMVLYYQYLKLTLTLYPFACRQLTAAWTAHSPYCPKEHTSELPSCYFPSSFTNYAKVVKGYLVLNFSFNY